LARTEPSTSLRRKAVISHQLCGDEEGQVSTLGFYVHLAQHFTCPAGYDPQTSSFGSWPSICKGPSDSISKRANMVAETNPHSCAPCVPATGEKLLFETDFEWNAI